MTHLQIFVKESKMKTKTYPLLQFRDKIQNIRETIFPILINIDRTDISDAEITTRKGKQNAEITTGKGKHYTKQIKNLLQNKEKLFFQIEMELTVAQKNLLMPKNLYQKEVLHLFLIQQMLTGLIWNVILIILSTSFAAWHLNKTIRIKKMEIDPVRFKYIRS